MYEVRLQDKQRPWVYRHKEAYPLLTLDVRSRRRTYAVWAYLPYGRGEVLFYSVNINRTEAEGPRFHRDLERWMHTRPEPQ